jgi:tRNA (guanine-N7-)-methyltransferase
MRMARPLSSAVSEILVDWRTLAWPIDWSTVFGREAELALEIGFGNGAFLAELAHENPERDHVGLELSWSGALRLFPRLERTGATNARALLVDADVALQRFFLQESLSEVFVNHPCPWPKARHHGRRLLDGPGLALLADRMRTGARLTVVTDHAEYAEWLTEVLEAQNALVSCHETTEVAEIPGRRPTKYQRKAMEQGIPIHYFEWRRSRAPVDVPAAPTPPPTTPMPSLTLRGGLPEADLLEGFAPRLLRERHEGVEVVVRLRGAYRRLGEGRRTWLVEGMVQEDRLRQDVAVLVAQRGPEEVLVKLAGLGRPHPTHGVRRAVFGVGLWLLERHPGLALAHETLGAPATTPIEPRPDDAG